MRSERCGETLLESTPQEQRKIRQYSADDKPVDTRRAREEALQEHRACPAGLAAEAWRLHASEDDDAEEAELSVAQSRARAAFERL